MAAILMLLGTPSATMAGNRGPTETVVLLPEGITNPKVLRELFEHHLKTARPGTRVHVVHGGRFVASYWVPNGAPQTRHRSRHVARPWAKVVRLLSSPIEGSDQVNLPDLGKRVRSLLETKLPCRVSIYGSPLYLDPRKQAYNHEGKFVTADGAIDLEPSPWRTKVKLPADTLVTWITPDANYGYDTVHRQYVDRFNRLFVQEIDGTLTRISDKPEQLFHHFAPEKIEHIVKLVDGNTTRVQRSEDTVVEGGDPTGPFAMGQGLMTVAGREATNTANDREAMVAEAMRNANRVMVIITWKSEDPNCDLDMWLTSNGLEGELNHANPDLPWAELTRDVQHTEHASGEADIEKHEGVLVKHGRIEDLTLWINVYRTRSPATVTITRIWNRNKQSRTVEIKTEAGDGGRYQRYRVGSTAWKRVNLLRFSASNLPGDL
jgi:hypothetical protein